MKKPEDPTRDPASEARDDWAEKPPSPKSLEPQTYRSEYEQAFQRGCEQSAERIAGLERELQQAKEALAACREDSAELLAERSWWKDETRGGYRSRYYDTMENILRADEILDPLNNPKL